MRRCESILFMLVHPALCDAWSRCVSSIAIRSHRFTAPPALVWNQCNYDPSCSVLRNRYSSASNSGTPDTVASPLMRMAKR
jgi:hypothetical protein